MRLKLLKTLLLLSCGFVLLVGCSEQQSEQSEKPQTTAAPTTSAAPATPQTIAAPDITLPDIQGNQVSLSDLKGKVVLLNFWATWCPPCKEEMPSMEQLYRRFKDQGLVILAVNIEQEGQQAVPAFLQKTPYTFPILLDTEAVAQNTYKVFKFPETFIIDRNGNVVEKVIGAIDWTSPKALKFINFLLNG